MTCCVKFMTHKPHTVNLDDMDHGWLTTFKQFELEGQEVLPRNKATKIVD